MPDGLPGQEVEVGGGTFPADRLLVVDLAASILAGFSTEQVRQLHEAHLSRGRAFRDGAITDPEVTRFISESNWRLSELKGHPWLRKKRIFGIPRLVETDVPWPLFPPQARGVLGDIVYLVVSVLDLAAYVPVMAYKVDPLGEFSRPVPITESLDVEQALGISGLRYSALAARRRSDAGLRVAVENVRGASRYRTREFLRWIEERSFEPALAF